MKLIKSFEPLTERQFYVILKAFGPLQAQVLGLTTVDLAAGVGVIDENTKCVWTKFGRRIELWKDAHGGYGAAAPKEIDPLYKQRVGGGA